MTDSTGEVEPASGSGGGGKGGKRGGGGRGGARAALNETIDAEDADRTPIQHIVNFRGYLLEKIDSKCEHVDAFTDLCVLGILEGGATVDGIKVDSPPRVIKGLSVLKKLIKSDVYRRKCLRQCHPMLMLYGSCSNRCVCVCVFFFSRRIYCVLILFTVLCSFAISSYDVCTSVHFCAI